MQNKPRTVLRYVSVFFLSLLFASPALACPLCHTETGKAVRASVFGPDFGFNFLVTLLPFLVFGGVTAAIYYGLPMPKRVRQKPMRENSVNKTKRKPWK